MISDRIGKNYSASLKMQGVMSEDYYSYPVCVKDLIIDKDAIGEGGKLSPSHYIVVASIWFLAFRKRKYPTGIRIWFSLNSKNTI
jgi:hypothetical protein